jgi:anti-sigma B factor antagonist
MPEQPDIQPPANPAAARANPPFACSRTEGGMDAAWVHVAGELDIATTPQLVETLHASMLDVHLVVLDLRELAFMDSAGVHAIVAASNRARRAGRRLLLLRGPAHVDRIFSLTVNSDEVETGDLAPVVSSAGSLQRSMVAASLLSTNGNAHGGAPSH